MARKNRDDFDSEHETPPPVICALCGRETPEDQQEAHHLVPKSKGGKQTVMLHRVCHDQIHAIFTDAQLAKKFSTIDAILEDEAVQKFVTWIKTKPPGFADSARDARGSSGRGRR